MITATDLELTAGGRLLLEPVTFQVAPGDRIGLVGRNGAGKTTLARVLAGESLPAAAPARRSAPVAYLPQDPRTGDPSVIARDRILGRGASTASCATCRPPAPRWAVATASTKPGSSTGTPASRSISTSSAGGRPRLRPARSASSLGLPERVLTQQLGTLSGGQRRRVELSRVLFSGAPTLILDEPTNHLDADSIAWLRNFLRAHDGGLMVISHDGDLLDSVVNKVFHLDATRTQLDVYRLGWKAYLEQLATDERRRRRERANAERKVVELRAQADRMRAKATKARMAHNLDRRATRLTEGLEDVRRADKVAKLRFPAPSACGKTPLTATGLTKSYGSLEVFSGVDLAIDRGSRVVILGLNGAGKTTLLRVLSGIERPDAGEVVHGHGLQMGYYAQEHETLDPSKTVYENVRHNAPPSVSDAELRRILGRFSSVANVSSSSPGHCPAGRRPGWHWRPSSSRQRTCSCSTSRRTTSTPPAGARC